MADGVLRHPPVVPGKDSVVNWVLKMGNEVEDKLLPVLVLVVISCEQFVQFLNLSVDILNDLASMLHLQVIGHLNIGVRLHVFLRRAAITRVIRVRLAIQLRKSWLNSSFVLLLSNRSHLILHVNKLVA